MGWIDSLFIGGIGNGNRDNHRAAVIDRIAAYDHDWSRAPLFGALDRFQMCVKNITAKNLRH